MTTDITEIDLDRVSSIVYSIETMPDAEDYDINDYNSPEEMQEDMLYAYEFEINFYDLYGERMNEGFVIATYEDVVDNLGQDIANQMVKGEGRKRQGNCFELDLEVDTKPKTMSLQDVDEVAKRLMPIAYEYTRNLRGFILYDGTIVQTDAEHSMRTIIDGINSTFDFIRIGNIRILNQSIDIEKPPTPQQRRVLMDVINSYSDSELYVDILPDVSVKYYQPDYRRVLADIDRYFENGIKPTGSNLYESIITEEKETTFYRFYSEIRSFLNKLMKTPIKAQPTKYLTDRGLTRDRLIKLLMTDGIIERKERILIPGKDDVKSVKYSVKYTIKQDEKESFEEKLERIHARFFGQEKKKINENNILKNMSKRIIFTEEQMKYIMECKGISNDILEEEGGGATTCASVGAGTTRGDVGYDAPAFDTKKNKKFWKDSMVHQKPGGISMNKVK